MTAASGGGRRARGPALGRLGGALLVGCLGAGASCGTASGPAAGPPSGPAAEADRLPGAPSARAEGSAPADTLRVGDPAAGGREPGTGGSPVPGEVDGPELPPIPEVDGPLRIRVVYPTRGQRLPVADSSFLFGSLGTGAASLWIEGEPVPVKPNGAFLAWLPVPMPERGDTAVYRLRAVRGTERDSVQLQVLLPVRPFAGRAGTAWLDTAALRSDPVRWLLPDEAYPMEVRGAPGLEVWLEAGTIRFPFLGDPDPEATAPPPRSWAGRGAPPPAALYRAGPPAARLLAAACGLGTDLPSAGCDLSAGRADSVPVALVGTDGRDTTRLARRLTLRVLDPSQPLVARLRDEPDPVQGRRGVVMGRTTPRGPYHWLFPPDARVELDGREGDRYRAALAPGLAAWFAAEELEPLPAGTPPPRSVVGDLRVEPSDSALILRVPLRVALPAEVRQADERTLALTLFGAFGGSARAALGRPDPLLEAVEWTQLPGARTRITLRLREPVWGYRMSYERGFAGSYEGPRGVDVGAPGARDPVLRLEVRRPPEIDRGRPLRGRRIAIDPGHPPGGSLGPTGLYEGEANLAVSLRLAGMLREAGAEPVLVRVDTLPVGLYERTGRAERAGAEIFVSIHNNALPDGVRPFDREGSGTYFHHPHARRLAALVQDGLARSLGLPDLGILWADLAVTRTTWMPAVLTEGAFMMLPAHEAALRTPDFQERYARGVLEGVEAFLRERAEAVAGRGAAGGGGDED